VDMGLLDDMAHAQVDEACHYAPIWHNASLRKPCMHLRDIDPDGIGTAIVKAMRDEPPKEELPPAPTVRKSWIGQRLPVDVCYETLKACEPEDARVCYSSTDKVQKTELTSERPYAKEANSGHLYRAVGADVNDVISQPKTDVVLYVFFGRSELNDLLAPAFDRFAQICFNRRPPSLRFVTINAKLNELPPNWGLSQIESDTIILYHAEDKETPILMEFPATRAEHLTLYDYWHWAATAVKHKPNIYYFNTLYDIIEEYDMHSRDWLTRVERSALDKKMKKAWAKEDVNAATKSVKKKARAAKLAKKQAEQKAKREAYFREQQAALDREL